MASAIHPRLTAAQLRREIAARNLSLPDASVQEVTYGASPCVVYAENEGRHGNFLAASYRRILADESWARRLRKRYSADRQVPYANSRRRRELDAANSSDALLMNVFCYPGALKRRDVLALLGVERGVRPSFGVRLATPLRGGHQDRTELDMQVGDLLVEAKLTESHFQSARADLLRRYIDLEEVFGEMPGMHDGSVVTSYQLMRGILRRM